MPELSDQDKTDDLYVHLLEGIVQRVVTGIDSKRQRAVATTTLAVEHLPTVAGMWRLARAQRDALQARIDAAPHSMGCHATEPFSFAECDCWKNADA